MARIHSARKATVNKACRLAKDITEICSRESELAFPVMGLLFNPFRVVSRGRPAHSRGSHPGLFYATPSGSLEPLGFRHGIVIIERRDDTREGTPEGCDRPARGFDTASSS